MLAIWSLVPLPFLKPAWTSGSSRFTYRQFVPELGSGKPLSADYSILLTGPSHSWRTSLFSSSVILIPGTSSAFPGPVMDSVISPKSLGSCWCHVALKNQDLSSRSGCCCQGVLASRLAQHSLQGNVHTHTHTHTHTHIHAFPFLCQFRLNIMSSSWNLPFQPNLWGLF